MRHDTALIFRTTTRHRRHVHARHGNTAVSPRITDILPTSCRHEPCSPQHETGRRRVEIRVGIRLGQSDSPIRVRPRFLGPGRGQTQRSAHDLGHGSGSVSSILIVGRIILRQSCCPRFVRSDGGLSRRCRLFNMKWDRQFKHNLRAVPISQSWDCRGY